MLIKLIVYTVDTTEEVQMKCDESLLLQEQLRLERDMYDGGVTRYRRAQERHLRDSPAETDWNRRLTKDLVVPLAAGIAAFIENERSKGRGRVAEAVPALECLPTDTAAMITLKVLLGTIGSDNSFAYTATRVGGAIEDHVRFTKLEDAAPKYIAAVRASLKKARSKKYSHQRNVMATAEAHLSKQEQQNTSGYAVDIDRWVDWSTQTKLKVGATLIGAALHSLEYNGEPVFEKRSPSRMDAETIELNPNVTQWINEYKDFMECLAPEYGPCVVKPRDWVNPFNGGYYTPELNRTLLLAKVSKRRHLKPLTKERMPRVYAAVNKLQAVRWEINRELIEIIQRIQNQGSGLGLPSSEPTPRPVNPVRDEFDGLRGKELLAAMHPDEQREFQDWKTDMRQWYESENERVATLLSSTRTISAAKLYSSYPYLHFVYTVDSRGRIYSRSSTVSPQGGDLQKALIQFHKGKALGKRGRYWLAVQGAGCYGVDKVSFDARVAFIEEMEEEIRDIATDPLTFTGWLEADGGDSRWQFLAFCLEWNRLLEWEDSGRDAEDFVSHIPVAQDGSCSGLQHYSGMLADARGGSAVNLVDRDAPEDIYREVAGVLMDKLGVLANSLNPADFEATKMEPKDAKMVARQWLELGINRSLTKRPVMVLPYGGTQTSTHNYVEEWLSDKQKTENYSAKLQGREPNKAHPFRDHPLGQRTCTLFLTRLLWESIGEVVVAARAAMRCIQQVAFRLGKENKPLIWTTPNGFTVTQEIYATEEKRVRTFFHGEMLCRNVLHEEADYLCKYGMKSASAPNFVHSMDACHLQSVVVESEAEDLACIHDSSGTYAADTDALRDTLRIEFFKMYSETNLIEDFVLNCEEQSKVDLSDIEIPAQGSLDLNQILKSTYLFG